MSDLSNNKPPVWFWIVAVVALFWNGMGVLAYLGQAFLTDEIIAELPVEQQAELLVEYPTWYTTAFALAVFCGALGCLALLIRKKWATILFVVSLIAATVQHVYLFMTVEGMSLIMPIMIIVVGLALIWFARMSTSKGWIK
ncbi:hypothetical protein A9Q86_02330 [Flavobacteriales bacterium 33_180_T64]|nr:hypothetical protein A9Q86_02330 [Flavobacteriales bacterium 33_180_T64]